MTLAARARFSLMLCAFGIHSWQLRRTQRIREPEHGHYDFVCARCWRRK